MSVKIMQRWLGVAVGFLATCAPAAHAQAPDWLLPLTRHFVHPLADAMAPRFAIGLIATDLLRSRGPERPQFTIRDSTDAAFDVQATAALGGTLPLLRLGNWPGGGAVLGGEVAVFARFRIEYPSRDAVGTDWFVGVPLELRRYDWSGRVAIMHRSAHLGDEFITASGAQRIEFGHESVELMAARRFGAARIYGGGAWIFRSNTAFEMRRRGLGQHDRFELQAGADGEWPLGGTGRVYAGLDVQAAERTDWQTEIAAVAGAGAHANGRAIRLLARFHHGVSPLGEFFLTDERFVSLELEIEP